MLFSKNLTTGAAEPHLQVASLSWKFSHFGEYRDGLVHHCQLCHARIQRWSEVVNAKTDLTIRIGLDCHDKLAHLQGTGELVTINPHREHVRKHKKWSREHITASVFTWLKVHAPKNLQEAVQFIDRNGYPRSISEGEELVAYYKKRNLQPRELWKFTFDLFSLTKEEGAAGSRALRTGEYHPVLQRIELPLLCKLLTFSSGRNPKSKELRYEAHHEGRVFVLGWSQKPPVENQPCMVSIIKVLVPGKVYLVKLGFHPEAGTEVYDDLVR